MRLDNVQPPRGHTPTHHQQVARRNRRKPHRPAARNCMSTGRIFQRHTTLLHYSAPACRHRISNIRMATTTRATIRNDNVIRATGKTHKPSEFSTSSSQRQRCKRHQHHHTMPPHHRQQQHPNRLCRRPRSQAKTHRTGNKKFFHGISRKRTKIKRAFHHVT